MSKQDKRYEKPTDELRQVTKIIDYSHQDYSGSGYGLGSTVKTVTINVVMSVQRKWLVQDGERYEKETTKFSSSLGPNEVIVGISRLENNPFREWCFVVKTKEEWRDLPSYTPKPGEGGYV